MRTTSGCLPQEGSKAPEVGSSDGMPRHTREQKIPKVGSYRRAQACAGGDRPLALPPHMATGSRLHEKARAQTALNPLQPRLYRRPFGGVWIDRQAVIGVPRHTREQRIPKVGSYRRAQACAGGDRPLALPPHMATGSRLHEKAQTPRRESSATAPWSSPFGGVGIDRQAVLTACPGRVVNCVIIPATQPYDTQCYVQERTVRASGPPLQRSV